MFKAWNRLQVFICIVILYIVQFITNIWVKHIYLPVQGVSPRQPRVFTSRRIIKYCARDRSCLSAFLRLNIFRFISFNTCILAL